MAFAGVLGLASAYIMMRKVSTRASAAHTVAYVAFLSSLLAGTLLWWQGDHIVLPETHCEVVCLVLLSLFGLAAQLLTVLGLQRTKASRASSALYLQLVFVTCLFHTSLAPMSTVGMLMILLAAFYGTFIKR